MKQPLKNYTLHEIADRFEEAASTLKRLPSDKMTGCFSSWPPIVRTVQENLGAESEPMRLGPPPPEAISRMEETIQWIFLIQEEDERRLIWLRAACIPWRPICQRIGCGRTKAYHLWRTALSKITSHLNAKADGNLTHSKAARGR